MRKIDLQRESKISGNVLARLGKDEYVSMDSIDKICTALQCNIGDIMDCIPDQSAEDAVIKALGVE